MERPSAALSSWSHFGREPAELHAAVVEVGEMVWLDCPMSMLMLMLVHHCDGFRD
jgi:hypothetical protein